MMDLSRPSSGGLKKCFRRSGTQFPRSEEISSRIMKTTFQVSIWKAAHKRSPRAFVWDFEKGNSVRYILLSEAQSQPGGSMTLSAPSEERQEQQ